MAVSLPFGCLLLQLMNFSLLFYMGSNSGWMVAGLLDGGCLALVVVVLLVVAILAAMVFVLIAAAW